MATETHDLVSIVIAVFNKELYIDRTIQSVVEQTYKNIEVVIVDDCSTDESVAMARRWEDRHTNIKLLCNTENRGTAATRNRGLAGAKGFYVLLLDGDDLLTPWAVKVLVDSLEQSSKRLGFGNLVMIDEKGYLLSPPDRLVTKDSALNSVSNWIVHNVVGCGSGVIFERSLLEEAGYFDESGEARDAAGCDDWIFYLSLRRFTEFSKVTHISVGYRYVANAQSRNYRRMWNSHRELVEMVHRWFPKEASMLCNKSSSNFAFVLFIDSCKNKNIDTAVMYFLRSFRANPIYCIGRLSMMVYRKLCKKLTKLTINPRKNEIEHFDEFILQQQLVRRRGHRIN